MNNYNYTSLNSDTIKNIVQFFFEAGMLRYIPRSGYPFLGTGKENVAEHSYRTAIIGYILAKECGANPEHTSLLCLFHDFPEVRIGDLNYINHIYVKANARKALKDSISGINIGESILSLWDEYSNCQTLEAIFAHDADQLDLALNLKVEQNLGNPYAKNWLENLFSRLKSSLAKELYHVILISDHTDWWYKQKNKCWWETRELEKDDSHKK